MVQRCRGRESRYVEPVLVPNPFWLIVLGAVSRTGSPVENWKGYLTERPSASGQFASDALERAGDFSQANEFAPLNGRMRILHRRVKFSLDEEFHGTPRALCVN